MKKRIVNIVSLGVGALLIYGLIIFSLILSSSKEAPPSNIGVMIVLGAKVNGENPAYPSRPLKERLDTAYEYLDVNKETVVIVTGGQGANESQSEGSVMAKYLIDKGIEKQRVFTEERSTSTLENIEYALEIIDADSVVIVSNDYHIYRAKRTAQLLGVEHVYGLAAPSKTIAVFTSYLREIVALGYHLIFTN